MLTLVKRIHAVRTRLTVVAEKVSSYADKRQSIVLSVAHKQLAIYRQLAELLQQYQVPLDRLRDPHAEQDQDQEEEEEGGGGGGGGGGGDLNGEEVVADWRAAAVALATSSEQLKSGVKVPVAREGINSNNKTETVASTPPLPDTDTIEHPTTSLSDQVEPECTAVTSTKPHSTRQRAQQGHLLSGEYFEISAEDFQGVPAHIRGRCGVADTNNLLRKLQEDFRKQAARKGGKGAGNNKKRGVVVHVPEKVPLPALEAAGLRVCGQTGRCVLGVLQRLGHVEWARHQADAQETVSLSTSLCRQLAQLPA